MVDKNASTDDKEKENIVGSVFDEQCYLIHHFKQFFQLNENTTYENFVSIIGEPGILISKLLGTGMEEIFNIEPYQLSLLQPKIRLFKTYYEEGKEKSIELVFNDFYHEDDIEVLIKNSGQRGFGVGLKSFDWEDMGTNPGDTGKAFSATLTLFCQTLYDLFGEQLDKETGKIVSFADLIRIPVKEFNTKGAYNDQYFRIKVQLGWQIPTDYLSLFKEELKTSITNSSITLFLTLTDHDITLNRDGTAHIVANYIGAIEGKMLSPETDILYVDADTQKLIGDNEKLIGYEKSREATLKKNVETGKVTGKRGFIDRLSDLRPDEGSILPNFGKLFNDGSIIPDFNKIFDTRSNDELELTGVKGDIEARIIVKENLFRKDRAIAYQRFLTSLEKTDRIFYVDLDKNDLDVFQDLKNDILDVQNTPPAQLEKIKADKIVKSKVQSNDKKVVIKQYNSSSPDNPTGLDALISSLDKVVQEANNTEREKAIDALNKKFTEATSPKEDGKVRINFIYFGDIVNAALSVIRDNNQGVSEQTRTNKQDLKNNFRFLLGPIEMYDYQTEDTYIKNLADVPISVDLFNAWFLKKVIRPQLDKYLLRDFLRDICAELITRAISPECLGPYSKAIQNRVSFSVFNIGSAGADAFAPNGTFGNARFSINQNANYDFARLRSLNVDQTKQYFMIYIGGFAPHTLKGNYLDDIEKGIYHLYFGADKGIVKNIAFSKVDMQYLKEARIVNYTQTKKGDVFFVEPYNASIEMWGNSVYKPGMMLYIDPKSVGLPLSIPKNKRIPLGGYYTIIKVKGHIKPGAFNTTLEVNWESSGEDEEQTHINQSVTFPFLAPGEPPPSIAIDVSPFK